MKNLTKDDVISLKIGTKLRIAGGNNFMTTEVIYVGLFKNGLGSELYTFVDLGHGKRDAFTLSSSNMPNIPIIDHTKKLFWNYEDACEHSRQSMCELLEHYNAHQFKNNPIEIIN